MLSPFDQALDLSSAISWGRLIRTPFQPGVWSLLESMGAQNHAPQLCWLSPSRLACVWMAGGGEGTAEMSVVMSLLEDGAQDWTEPQLISQDATRSEQNPLLFVSEGCLHLIHSAQRVRDPEDSTWRDQESTFSMQWTAVLRHQSLRLDACNAGEPSTWSADCWTAAEDLIATPAFCRHPPLAQTDGTWLLPIYRSLEAGGAFGHDHSELLVLDGQARVIGDPIAVPASKGRVHGSLVPAAHGTTLLQFFRSRLADNVYRSVSADDGRSWSEPEPVALPNNNSSIQALRLASGRLAMIFNRFNLRSESDSESSWGDAHWPRTRWPLSLAISDDDGDRWPWIRDLDTGFGFQGPRNWMLNGQLAYPTLLEGQPGELHYAYSWGGRQAIRYGCIHESDILGEFH